MRSVSSPNPGTLAIASRFSTASLVSICIMTSTLSFDAEKYSDEVRPQWEGANGLPKPLLPAGGNRLSDTTSAAFSAVDIYLTVNILIKISYGLKHTMGTKTPLAPESRAYLICQLVLVLTPVAGILTIGLGPFPPQTPWIAWIDSAAPGCNEVRPCSQSIRIHERCGLASATVRATNDPGSMSQAPYAGVEVLKAFKRACVIMVAA